MDLGMTDRVKPLVEAVRRMVADEIAPLDREFHAEVGRHPSGDRFQHTKRQTEILRELKAKARERGLWNLWLTDSQKGRGLTTVEYADLAEEMGKVQLAAEVFNCSAPDTGNMEVFERFGSEKHKKRWLTPLMEGEIRSAYLMTEPQVASSDATNIELSAVQDGDDWILNGEKWWSTGAGDPRCAVFMVLALSDREAGKHARHTMFVVPADAKGIELLRPMRVFGDDDAPHGHMHVSFKDVR
ncbi:MAG: acyl-CoA dehydrogenase family protein, partial [Pseudomonadota bacterium]